MNTFIFEYPLFSLVLLALNLLLSMQVVYRLGLKLNRQLYDAMGGRGAKSAWTRRWVRVVRSMTGAYEKKYERKSFYIRAKEKMKKSGYNGEHAAVVYLSLKFLLIPALSLVSLIANYPGFHKALIQYILTYLILELVVASRRRKLNLKFQKHVYKIYKFLHNQISSGVKVTDAIKTVYTVIEDEELKRILIRLAARFELTLDIDAALDEFKSNFSLKEAETLCIALKQGVMTGDNRELLERQEDVMFKKYFNYIQAETDSCRLKSTLAAAMFCAAIVIMVAIPLLKDATDAVGKIFVN